MFTFLTLAWTHGFFSQPNLCPGDRRFSETYWLWCIWQKSSIHTRTHLMIMILTLAYTQVRGFFSQPNLALVEDSTRPIDYSVSDIRVVFSPAPTPWSWSSLLHTHRSMGFFHNQTFALVVADSPRPIDYSVSDIRVGFTPVPTPCSYYSLSLTHRSMGFFHNQTFVLVVADSSRPIDYSGLSVMSGLGRNPANRQMTSSSGALEHQDIFFLDFFSFCIFQKTWKNMVN